MIDARATGSAAIVLLVLTLLSIGCASSGPTSVPQPSPSVSPTTSGPASPAAQRCGSPRSPSRSAAVRTGDGLRLPAYETGSGPRGVVLVHETGSQALCGWWPYAAHLADHGYRVLIFDLRCYGQAPCPTGSAMDRLTTDVAAAVQRVRDDGARSVVLIGASLGGSVVIAAGARPPTGVTAVVSLSGDLFRQPMSSTNPPLTADTAAPYVRLPLLFALARGDPLVTPSEARGLVAEMPTTSKRVLVLGQSSGHGWDMLVGARPGSWSSLDSTLQAFLVAHSR